ncbi:unnamed protein product [Closterium sp. Naga37s-1]|nr:unnamed protein product [Closterium sp. Naga37s-1]
MPIMSREELLVVLEKLSEQLRRRLSAMHENSESLLQWENAADWAEGLPAAAAEAPGGQEEGAQTEEGQGERIRSHAGALQQLRHARDLKGQRQWNQQQQSFESIALAAVFDGLRRLAVVQCGWVGEEQLRAVLRACRVLVELRVEHCHAMSDALLLSCPIHTLTHATLIACKYITAAGVIGLLASFPRLRQLKVEADKVSEQARRKLLRAGVVVRGV